MINSFSNSQLLNEEEIVWQIEKEEDLIHNIDLVLSFSKRLGFDLEKVSSTNLLNGNPLSCISLVWEILKFGIQHQLLSSSSLRVSLSQHFRIEFNHTYEWDADDLLFGWINLHLREAGFFFLFFFFLFFIFNIFLKKKFFFFFFFFFVIKNLFYHFKKNLLLFF